MQKTIVVYLLVLSSVVFAIRYLGRWNPPKHTCTNITPVNDYTMPVNFMKTALAYQAKGYRVYVNSIEINKETTFLFKIWCTDKEKIDPETLYNEIVTVGRTHSNEILGNLIIRICGNIGEDYAQLERRILYTPIPYDFNTTFSHPDIMIKKEDSNLYYWGPLPFYFHTPCSCDFEQSSPQAGNTHDLF